MAEYTPQVASQYRPFLTGGPVDDSVTEPPSPLHFRTFKLPPTDPDVLAYGPNGVLGWEIKIDDLRGGYAQSGDFARGANELDGDYRMTSYSTLDQRFRRHLVLPGITRNTVRGGGGFHPFNACHIGTTLYMARSTPLNYAQLWREDSGGVVTQLPLPVIAQMTAAMVPIVIGGSVQPERLCMLGDTPTNVINPSGALDGTMHGNLDPAFGLITSPINAISPGTGTHLFYANNGIWALSITAAIGANPIQTLANVPNGGYAIGAEKLVHGTQGLRAYWAWPKDDFGYYSVLDSQIQPAPVQLMSTNMEGTDPLPVNVPLMWVSYACLWRRNIVAADPSRIILHDGDSSRDLHIFANRQLYRGKYQVCGLLVNDNDLFALVAKVDTTVAPVLYSMWIEQFLPQFDAWVPVTGILPYIGNIALGELNPYDAPMLLAALCPRYPVSRKTGFAYLPGVGVDAAAQTWNQAWLAPAGQNPYYNYQGTVGYSQNAVARRAWETQGTWTGPFWEFPNLEGRWKRADQIIFLGDVDNANADCYVDISLNGDTPVRFTPGQPHIAQLGDTGTQAPFTQLQVSITLWRGSFEYKTPNGIPVMIRGRAYLADPETNLLGLPPGP